MDVERGSDSFKDSSDLLRELSRREILLHLIAMNLMGTDIISSIFLTLFNQEKKL